MGKNPDCAGGVTRFLSRIEQEGNGQAGGLHGYIYVEPAQRGKLGDDCLLIEP